MAVIVLLSTHNFTDVLDLSLAAAAQSVLPPVIVVTTIQANLVLKAIGKVHKT